MCAVRACPARNMHASCGPKRAGSARIAIPSLVFVSFRWVAVGESENGMQFHSFCDHVFNEIKHCSIDGMWYMGSPLPYFPS